MQYDFLLQHVFVMYAACYDELYFCDIVLLCNIYLNHVYSVRRFCSNPSKPNNGDTNSTHLLQSKIHTHLYGALISISYIEGVEAISYFRFLAQCMSDIEITRLSPLTIFINSTDRYSSELLQWCFFLRNRQDRIE